MQKKLQDPFVASVDKAVTKRVNARAVSRSASWQWALTTLVDGSVQATPDFVGRASAAERRTERFVTQRYMRSLLRELGRADCIEVVKDPNGIVLSGVVKTSLPKEHVQYGALDEFRFVGPVAVSTVTTAGRTWTGHRGIFKKQAVRREAVKALVGFAGKTTARKTAFDKYLAD